jgi:hypothetical protein
MTCIRHMYNTILYKCSSYISDPSKMDFLCDILLYLLPYGNPMCG